MYFKVQVYITSFFFEVRVRPCLFLYFVLANMSVLLEHKKGKKGKPCCHGRFHELDALHCVRLIPQLRGHGVRPLKNQTKILLSLAHLLHTGKTKHETSTV